jgi:hypothetical protein
MEADDTAARGGSVDATAAEAAPHAAKTTPHANGTDSLANRFTIRFRNARAGRVYPVAPMHYRDRARYAASGCAPVLPFSDGQDATDSTGPHREHVLHAHADGHATRQQQHDSGIHERAHAASLAGIQIRGGAAPPPRRVEKRR